MGTTLASAAATLFPAFLAFLITIQIVGLTQLTQSNHFAHELHLLGKSVEQDALTFNTTIIGVLASLLIAQVLARRSTLKTPLEIRNYVSVALFAHLLAGLAVVASLLSVIGAIGNSANIRHLWVIAASMIVAVGVAQWIEWSWARNRRLLRRRTRVEVTVNAWSIHRLTALLPPHQKVRRRPVTKLLLHLLLMSVTVTAAAAGSMEILVRGTTHNFPTTATTAAYVGTIAILSTACVLVASLVATVQITQMLLSEQRWSSLVWMLVTVWVVLPTTLLVAFMPWNRPELVSRTVGVLISVSLPFLPLVLPVKNNWSSLHHRLAATSLKIVRIERLTLLRDLWTISPRIKEKEARIRRLKKIYLRCNRPPAGLGSIDWQERHLRE
ncbi:hypothetical protein ITJ38_17755 [Agreia pratensis]|uniref:hypothetical protein n=1 Tax=Agreia pratensis TaxID=150121 RepID=UPI00188A1ADF|nr:hypothetical protein [Agreia pratensis]MBF4636260.1 hypothetical protein [Agreia pratensis]